MRIQKVALRFVNRRGMCLSGILLTIFLKEHHKVGLRLPSREAVFSA